MPERREPLWRERGRTRPARIIEALRAVDRPLRTGEIAAALGEDPKSSSLKRTLRAMFEAGELARPAHGCWALPTTGGGVNDGR